MRSDRALHEQDHLHDSSIEGIRGSVTTKVVL
jgi:hypothetical protein